jgi:chloramphenicol 3-O-phosphotransferase
MTFPNPGIILITGIMASGKSTIAQSIAEKLLKSVHLRGDVFRRMIINDRAEMEKDFSAAAFEQLRLRYRLAATSADIYCQAGFTVVYQDVIIGAVLQEVVDMLRKWPLHVVVLCPSPGIVAQREAGREKTGYTTWTPQELDYGLRNDTPKIGLWLDTSALSVEETVKAIFTQTDQSIIRI